MFADDISGQHACMKRRSKKLRTFVECSFSPVASPELGRRQTRKLQVNASCRQLD